MKRKKERRKNEKRKKERKMYDYEYDYLYSGRPWEECLLKKIGKDVH